MSPRSAVNSTPGASQQESMPSGAESEVSTNSAPYLVTSTGGQWPAPARVTRRSSGSTQA